LIIIDIVAGIESKAVQLKYPRAAFAAMSNICATSMGGCSGALYSLFFSGIAESLGEQDPERYKTCKMAGAGKEFCKVAIAMAIEGFSRGVGKIRRYGGADIGDRTMVTSLTTI
jgi:hypothetical protein